MIQDNVLILSPLWVQSRHLLAEFINFLEESSIPR